MVALPQAAPYAYALPGGRRDRVVVTSSLLAGLTSAERRALLHAATPFQIPSGADPLSSIAPPCPLIRLPPAVARPDT